MNSETEKYYSELIIKSFIRKEIAEDTKNTILKLVDSDYKINPHEAKKLSWVTIFSDNWGYLEDCDMRAIIEWTQQNQIKKIQSTSIAQLSQQEKIPPIILELPEINSDIFWLIQYGYWMFGTQLTDLADRRLTTWREEIMFSEPFRFIISAIHDGYGYTYISGEKDFIEKILNSGPHEDAWVILD